MKRLLALSVAAIIFGCVTSTASAHTLTAKEKLSAKRTYYHATGYIKAIGKNARRTIYHPNHVKSEKWWAALKFLRHRQHRAWIKLHPEPIRPAISTWLVEDFKCIHRYEGAWNANTGNGYYGGLQMDLAFQSTYGADYVAKWGTADNWPTWAQMNAAVRAYLSGRGFGPWPNTARACNLI